MGNPILPCIDNTISNSIQNYNSQPIKVHLLLSQTRNLSNDELKEFFDCLFVGMKVSAKEAIMAIIWNSLSNSEQHRFELPCFGGRPVQINFSNVFIPSPTSTEAPIISNEPIRMREEMTSYSATYLANRSRLRSTNDTASSSLNTALLSIVSTMLSNAILRMGDEFNNENDTL
ncbi:hypothetical protein BC833DRAFT_595361 [Globomyces pollinis-pini]|nr:hypothetical protein BC833DRAFT_595361 [Globomyces pollinis-pini]